MTVPAATALAASRAPKSATQVQARRWRAMQVFFPAETSEQPLPRWFFDRSPSEVKAAFLTRRKKTELDQVCIPALVQVNALCQQLFIEGLQHCAE